MARSKMVFNEFTARALCIAALALLSATPCAARISDYRGTLGNAPIGFMLDYENSANSFDPKDFRVSAAHYFYFKHLKNINLRISQHIARTLVLEELDTAGSAIAVLKLEWPEFDPKGKVGARFGAPPENILGGVITGSWQSLQTGQTLPIYVVQSDDVGGGDGGRCGLTEMEYKHVEERAADFRAAFVRGDLSYLKKRFGWSPPKRWSRRNSQGFRQEIIQAVPHDLFCKDTRFMLGNGEVWFDEKGNVLR